MKTALAMILILPVLILSVSTSYAGELDDLFLRFIYGAIAITLVALMACVGFIITWFYSNMNKLFDLIEKLKKSIQCLQERLIALEIATGVAPRLHDKEKSCGSDE